MIPTVVLTSAYRIYSRYKKTAFFPATLDLELTNACNLDCVMCSRALMKRPTGFMSAELVKRIVEQAKEYPPRSIGLHLFGEPLLHTRLGNIMRIIKAGLPDTRLLLSTNACLLGRDISGDIISSGLDLIRFSVDGIDSSTYEAFRRGSDFERVVGNIKEFIKTRDSLGGKAPIIQIQMIGMAETAPQAKRFRKFWKPLLRGEDQIIVQEFMTFAGRVDDRTRFKMASFRDRFKRALPCLRLWKNLVIYWDGRVSACCYDYDGELLIGDVNKEAIKEIWRGKRLESMREDQLAGKKGIYSLCRSCVKQKGLRI